MKDPAVLLYIDNWLVSTKEMKADERGWYLNLILHQFDKGDLPSDLEELANLADVRFSEYHLFKQKWEQVLKQKFNLLENGRYENPKARDILKRREAFKDKRSKSGIIGYVVKVAHKELHATEDQIEFLKSTLDFTNLDTKNKQVLKQVLKQTLKLYINGNGNINSYSFLYKNIVEKNSLKIPQGFEELILEWLKYKAEKKQSYKETGLLRFINGFLEDSNSDIETAKKMLQHCMSKNYDGLFPLKGTEKTNGHNTIPVEKQQEYPDLVEKMHNMMKPEYR